MTIFMGQKIYEIDKENDEVRDIYEFTRNLSINSSQGPFYDKTNPIEYNEEEFVNLDRAFRILYKLIDFIYFVAVEIIKWSIEFGYTHAESISFQAFLILFYWVIVVSIIGIIVPLIIPFIALVYLSIIGARELYRRYQQKKKCQKK